MVYNKKYIISILAVFSFFTVYCSDCSGDHVSHYETALELFSTVKEKITSVYIDSIVEYILIQEPEYKDEKSQIHFLVQSFILSKEFKELWLNALIYFFSENEIKEIIRTLKNPHYNNSSEYTSTLFKRYEDIFIYLREKFIERLQLMLKKLKEKE